MSTITRSVVTRAFVFLLLAVAGQWMLRLGAREGALVEWECGGGECSTDDFAGAAPVFGTIAMFAAAFVVLPPGRRHLMTGFGLFLSAGATLVGLEEGVSAGVIERDGPAGFFLFGGTPTATVEIIMAVIAGLGLVIVAVLVIAKPLIREPAPRPAAPESAPDLEAEQTARVIAQLTRLRESGEIDRATYDTAVAKLMR